MSAQTNSLRNARLARIHPAAAASPAALDLLENQRRQLKKLLHGLTGTDVDLRRECAKLLAAFSPAITIDVHHPLLAALLAPGPLEAQPLTSQPGTHQALEPTPPPPAPPAPEPAPPAPPAPAPGPISSGSAGTSQTLHHLSERRQRHRAERKAQRRAKHRTLSEFL